MEFSENELLSMIYDNDEEVNEALYEKYSYLVNIVLNKYKNKINKLKLELEEVKQEALYALDQALTTYREDKEASITVYIVKVIDYKVKELIRKKLRKKVKEDIYTISLENYNINLLKIIPDIKYNPESITISNERYFNLINDILLSLSPNEKEIFNLIKENYSYQEISIILNISIKQVYNSTYRIKDKIKTIIEKQTKLC